MGREGERRWGWFDSMEGGDVVCLGLLVWWCHSGHLRNHASIISDFLAIYSHSAAGLTPIRVFTKIISPLPGEERPKRGLTGAPKPAAHRTQIVAPQ